MVWRFSGPRDASTIQGVLEEFDSSQQQWVVDNLNPSERHQYQVIAFCPTWGFQGSTLAGPAFTMNILEDQGSGVTYRGGPWNTITGPGFSGGTTHEATRVGGNARITFDEALAVACVTTRDFKASSDSDQDQVLVRCGIGPAHDCDDYGTAQKVTSAPRTQRMMGVRDFREWDAGSPSVSSRVRIIAENADGVDVDAFIIVVRCEPSC
jgi:hypothetical protein